MAGEIQQLVLQSDNGIGGYSPTEALDHAFAYDGSSSGRRDHVVFYRPGSGRISVLRREGNDFKAIYEVTQGGIGGFDFSFALDRAFAFECREHLHIQLKGCLEDGPLRRRRRT